VEHSGAVTLTWNLLDGGRTAARIREGEARVGQAQAQRALLDTGVRLSIARAHRTVASAKVAVTLSDAIEENARQRLVLAEGRYQEGMGTALEVSDAQLISVTAATGRVQARYDLAAARAQLLRALGKANQP
jgi:outer membrane protein